MDDHSYMGADMETTAGHPGVTGAGLVGAVGGGLVEIASAFWLIARGFTTHVVHTRAVGASESVRP